MLLDRRVDVAVVGAGPAGMMAALAASRLGAKVALFERQPFAGAKLCASGGGRGNLTNTLPADVFLKRFGNKARFVAPALRFFGSERLTEFLNDLGVRLRVEDGWRVYPASGRASDARDALLRRLAECGVSVFTSSEIESLIIKDGRVCGVRASVGTFSCRSVLLAAGGMTRPDLGGSDSGYLLAKQAGHSIRGPFPALAPIRTSDLWTGSLAGVVIQNARLRIKADGKKLVSQGSMLFTHSGVSGPAVLDISGFVAELLCGKDAVEILMDCEPGADEEEWFGRVQRWRNSHGAKKVANLLDSILPGSFAMAVMQAAGVSMSRVAAELTAGETKRIIQALKAFRMTAVGTGGFDEAMVTLGGVDVSEVDAKTLSSRKVTGLFFAGEILDVDGPTGGFNLQWAFSSGRLAGHFAATQVG